MTIQRSSSNGRFSASHDEKPRSPCRFASLEVSEKGSENGADDGSIASTIGSDEFSPNTNFQNDETSWSCYEDDLDAAEAKFETKCGLGDDEESSMEGSPGPGKHDDNEDEEEQSFSYLYGHMSASSASLSEDDLSLDKIEEDQVVDFGSMLLEHKKPDAVDYGYGEAVPDTEKQQAVDYGYGDATPDSDKQVVDYGYGDAAPDSDRPKPAARPKFVRRSSLKGMNGSSHSRASFCVGQGDEIEVQLPCQEKTIKRRRSITFSEEVNVTHIEKVTSMDGKKEELWFQKDEFKNIAIGAYREANKVKKGCTNTDTRGLENIINQKKMDKRVDKAIDLVFNALEVQYDNGQFDETEISDLYTLSAVDSKIDARIRARKDAREVEDYLRETRKAMGAMRRRMSM